MKKISIKNMTLAALFAAVVTVCSQISIPMPSGVPITLQTFAIALCGYVLGWQLSLVSVAVWMLLGAAGVPVFSNFRGGMGVLLGMTGGFIFGFLPFTALCGLRFKAPALRIACGLAGLAVAHLTGITQFSIVAKTPWLRSFLLVSAPYLIKDVVSVAAAYLLSLLIVSRVKKLRA